MMADAPHAPGSTRRAGALDVAKTVLFGLVGVRRKADHESVRMRPWQIIVAAIVALALFIFTLLTIVRIVLG
jgi:uncharacterized membrane protein